MNSEATDQAKATGVFGEQLQTVSTISSNSNPVIYGFTGQEYDTESSTYYYIGRQYDPEQAKFLSIDPVGIASGDTNMYRYVFNKPNVYVDPLGLDAYLASRDVYFSGAPASHNFIVIQNNSGVRTFSFGISSNGTLQNVEGSGTFNTDRRAIFDPDTKFTRINATDEQVIQAGQGVSNLLRNLDLQYTLPNTSNLTLNSNTAAQAVADIAQGSRVKTPASSFFGALGAENSGFLVRAICPKR